MVSIPDLSDAGDAPTLFRNAALRLAVNQGWPVFPLAARDKVPTAGSRGLHDATTDADRVMAWWSPTFEGGVGEDANIGLRTGDGLVVLDIDGADGEHTIAMVAARLGELPATLEARTGKGRHLYFRADRRITNSVGKLGPKLDVRGDGGYVVAPPSIHPSGARYAWDNPATAVARLPEAWQAALAAPPEKPAGSIDIPALPSHVAEGGRNDYLFRVAVKLQHSGLSGTALLAALDAENQARCDPPLSKRDVRGIAARVGEYAPDSSVLAELEAEKADTDEAAEGDPIAAMLPLQTWGDFRDTAGEEVPCIVPGLWPEAALGFIAGPPKSRKTWTALTLSIAIAAGRPFLGLPIPDGRPVLYVALEGARASIRHRVGALARGLDVDPDTDELDNLVWAYKPRGINLANPRWAEALRVQAERCGACLVVVDVLRAAAFIKENDAAEFAALAGNLAPIMGDGRSVALLHHYGKLTETSKERTPAERMSGSGAMFGALDVGLFLDGKKDGPTTVYYECRDMATPPNATYRLTGDGTGANGGYCYADTCRLELVDPDAPGTHADLLDLVKENRSGVKLADACSLMRLDEPALLEMAADLASEGVAIEGKARVGTVLTFRYQPRL